MKLDDSKTTCNSAPLTFSCYLALFGLICVIVFLSFLGVSCAPHFFVTSINKLDRSVTVHDF